jgi:hypothetical protein
MHGLPRAVYVPMHGLLREVHAPMHGLPRAVHAPTDGLPNGGLCPYRWPTEGATGSRSARVGQSWNWQPRMIPSGRVTR